MRADDPIFAAIEHCRRAQEVSGEAHAKVSAAYGLARTKLGAEASLSSQCTFVKEVLGIDDDELTDGPFNDLWDAYEAFGEMVPTTLTGLFAMLKFADEVQKRGDDAFSNVDILATFSTAADELAGRAS